MSEINSISDALQSYQLNVQNALGTQMMKQAAAAQQKLSDMIAEDAKKAQSAQGQSAQGGISIYV